MAPSFELRGSCASPGPAGSGPEGVDLGRTVWEGTAGGEGYVGGWIRLVMRPRVAGEKLFKTWENTWDSPVGTWCTGLFEKSELIAGPSGPSPATCNGG